jgi:hypothetical protein
MKKEKKWPMECPKCGQVYEISRRRFDPGALHGFKCHCGAWFEMMVELKVTPEIGGNKGSDGGSDNPITPLPKFPSGRLVFN